MSDQAIPLGPTPPGGTPVATDFAYPSALGFGEALGLTKRQWFAGQALAGLFSNPAAINMPGAGLANMCFAAADNMIAYEQREAEGELPPVAGEDRRRRK